MRAARAARLFYSSTMGMITRTPQMKYLIYFWVCNSSLNLQPGNFTLSFGRLRQRIVLKFVPHVQHDYFSHLINQSDYCFLVSSLLLLSSVLKLPNAAYGWHSRWRRLLKHFWWLVHLVLAKTNFPQNFVFEERLSFNSRLRCTSRTTTHADYITYVYGCHQRENTGSRLFTEVKPCWTGLISGWVTI